MTWRTVLALIALLWAGPTVASEKCWSGWGYRVAPQTLAFRGERMLLVTRGPEDWAVGEPVTLLVLDPESGRVDPDVTPLRVRPRRPRFFSTAEGNRAMDDVAGIIGEDLRLMLGMTRVGPAVSDTPKQQAFLRWACGRE